MNSNIKSICVFASSSYNIDQQYHTIAYNLGVEIANSHYDVVYGGSNRGLMGEVTNGARAHGSEVIGIMPEKLYNLGIEKGNCTKFILTKGMRERKAKMDELSQAVIALPGGFGTLEELSEMIVQKQLGYSNKPIVILNANNYYNSLINFFDEIITNKFASNNSKDLYYTAQTPNEAIKYIDNYDFRKVNYLNEKLILN